MISGILRRCCTSPSSSSRAFSLARQGKGEVFIRSSRHFHHQPGRSVTGVPIIASNAHGPIWPRVAPKRRLATDAAPQSSPTATAGAMKVEISTRAAKRLAEIKAKDEKPKLALRVMVESGGCHGFQYTMSLTEEFDDDEDVIFDQDGSRVVLDKPSLKLLNGSTIDYTNELIGSSFIVDNPLAVSKCGCGTSFDIKV